jgi:hypothetical protein
MSYSRGSYYIWSDGKRLHIWARDGLDTWNEPGGWAVREDGSYKPGYEGASGVSIPENVANAFAVMRFAELLEAGILDAIIDHLTKEDASRYFGGEALQNRAADIKAALKSAGRRDSEG